MGISMRKSNGGKNRVPHIIAFVLAVILSFVVVAFLPLSFEVRKLLFFVLIIVFAILSVVLLNTIGSKRK